MPLPHFTKEEWLPVGLILLTFVFGLALQPFLPAQLPTHWDTNGFATSALSRDFVVYFFPGLVLAIYALMLWVAASDPLRKNLVACLPAIYWLRLSVVVFLLLLHLFFLGAAINVWPAAMNLALTLDFSYLFLMFGRHLPQLRRNYFYGVRTPWTLESNQVWRKTHDLAGQVFALLAVVNLMGVVVPTWSFWITVLLILIAAAWLAAFSALEYRRENPRGAL